MAIECMNENTFPLYYGYIFVSPRLVKNNMIC